MSGRTITVPEDRTMAQPATAFCRNPACRQENPKTKQLEEYRFTIEHEHCACPKCGADRSPMVGTLVLTHLLLPDPQGPVFGSGGTKLKIACDSARAYLATVSNQEAATDQVKITNCPGCIAAAEKLKVKGIENNLLSGAESGRKFTTVPTVDGEPVGGDPPKQGGKKQSKKTTSPVTDDTDVS